MFFKTPNITADIVSVFDLKWNERNDRPESRPIHALSIRVKGDSVLSCDEEQMTLGDGDIAFFPADFSYTIRSGYEHLLIVHFRSPDALPSRFVKFSPKDPDHYEQRFRNLYRAWTKKDVGYEYECRAILYRILCAIEREIAATQPPAVSDRIADAAEYIHANFTEHTLCVEDLARLCGMSDTYFRRLFVARFGVTPLKYISDLRLARSMELLQAGYHTVEEISYMCGFNNISYFSTFFKKKTGVSPSAYREKMMG
jgi:AraC-like DNA-binding protein